LPKSPCPASPPPLERSRHRRHRPRTGVTSTKDHVDAHARRVLAGYERPKYIVFTDTLPKNPSGKILEKDLRTQHADLAGAPRSG
jgi:Acyl-CoA synthetases (AMP-forming)/AMP-acid ligases II